jgi:TolA-binding protein
VVHAPVEALALAGEDTLVRAAQAALRARRPYEATRLLAPLLADSARRTPAARLAGATAAARWGGWRQAEALLAEAPWVDTLAGGEGRELLARAALARRTPEGDTLAAAHARRALASAPAGTERGVRLVLLARALDRVATRPGTPPAVADSAARAYADAAAPLAPAASWLRLRAAGVEADAGRRASLYAGAAGAAAARARWTEAQARERFGDAAGAARLYDSLGSRAQALALRLRAAPDDRDAVRRALVAILATARGTTDARAAVELLDRSFAPLAPAEQLAAARSAAASGPLARAASGYAAALAGGVGDDADRFAYASLLFRLGRAADAAAQFALVRGARAGEAEYQRARALLRAGRGADAATLLRSIAATRAADSAAAGSALYLLGDLAVDDGRESDARDAFRGTAERYRGHPLAPTAAFRAALVSLVAGRHGEAARELDTLAARYPRGAERLAAGYWGGRAWSAAGDAALARARWTAVREAEPASYYARLAARRLGGEPWVPPDSAPAPAVPADVAAAIARAALLDELDMDVEARPRSASPPRARSPTPASPPRRSASPSRRSQRAPPARRRSTGCSTRSCTRRRSWPRRARAAWTPR